MLLSGVIGAVGAGVTSGEGVVVSVADLARAPLQQAWFAVIVLAVLASAGEFQHGTIRTTLLAAPKRVRVLLAQAVAAAVVGSVVVTAAVATSVAAGLVTAIVSDAELAGGYAADLGRVAAGTALGGVWAIAATGLGVLTRSTALSLVVLLPWRFVGESVVPVVLRDPGAYAWTPSGAGDALVGHGSPLLPVAVAALLLALYIVAICGAAGATFVRRDPARPSVGVSLAEPHQLAWHTSTSPTERAVRHGSVARPRSTNTVFRAPPGPSVEPTTSAHT
jgi:ABC-2 type transport system permease protein